MSARITATTDMSLPKKQAMMVFAGRSIFLSDFFAVTSVPHETIQVHRQYCWRKVFWIVLTEIQISLSHLSTSLLFDVFFDGEKATAACRGIYCMGGDPPL